LNKLLNMAIVPCWDERWTTLCRIL
jgi:hypothetical protein